MSTTAARVSGLWRDYRSDELIKNSFFLLLSTATQGILGAAFWLLAARLFNPDEIGQATALISATILLGYVSLLGLNSSVIRFLPTAVDGDAQIDNGIALPLVVATILATSYVFILPSLAGPLAFVRHSFLDASDFVLFTAMTALVLFTDAVFIARRQTKYNLLVDGVVQGGTKLVLPVALVSAGAFGIVAANGFAATLDVSLAGTVAAFAGHTFAGMFEGETRMGIRAEILHDIRVTSGAGLLADEIRRVRCRLRLGSCRLLLAFAGSERQPGSCEPGQ